MTFLHLGQAVTLDTEDTRILLEFLLYRMDLDLFEKLADKQPAIARKLMPDHHRFRPKGAPIPWCADCSAYHHPENPHDVLSALVADAKRRA